MKETDERKSIKTTLEEARNNRRQVWLTLLVMLGSSCLGVLVLMVILWVLFKKVIPLSGF